MALVATADRGHLPQYAYFKAAYALPGTGWTITGHSRSLERTGFWIPQLRCMFDAGVDVPTGSGARPLAVFLTHGHIDHCNALPMLLRHREHGVDPPTHVFAPAPILHRLRSFCQLSWAVKVDIEEELPEAYGPPPDAEALAQPGDVFETPSVVWRACGYGDALTTRTGKKAQQDIAVHTLRLFHKRITSVGYLLATPARTVKKLRPELMVAGDKAATGANVKAAKARGEDVNIEVREPEVPHFAFVLDTTIEAFMRDESATAERILRCPVVMTECTFLEASMLGEARKRGHTSWGELLPYIRDSAARRHAGGPAQTWMLVHFSLRYTDDDIVAFFDDAGACGMAFDTAGAGRTGAPDVVLWLDCGPRELWVAAAGEGGEA